MVAVAAAIVTLGSARKYKRKLEDTLVDEKTKLDAMEASMNEVTVYCSVCLLTCGVWVQAEDKKDVAKAKYEDSLLTCDQVCAYCVLLCVC